MSDTTTNGTSTPSTPAAQTAAAQANTPAGTVPQTPPETVAAIQKDNAKNPTEAGGQAEVQAEMDTINERGHTGVAVDPTPNENYTFKGQGKNLPTPETHPEQAAKTGSTRFAHVEADNALLDAAKQRAKDDGKKGK